MLLIQLAHKVACDRGVDLCAEDVRHELLQLLLTSEQRGRLIPAAPQAGRCGIQTT